MSQFWLWGLALFYLACINILTYLTFWTDKERAQMGLYRIPESTLYVLSMAGGSPAAFYAREKLRHKIRKRPFGAILLIIAVFQAVAIIGLFGGLESLGI
jgi:uncharacterized membrane protein YsdA (DUF1294 family)